MTQINFTNETQVLIPGAFNWCLNFKKNKNKSKKTKYSKFWWFKSLIMLNRHDFFIFFQLKDIFYFYLMIQKDSIFLNKNIIPENAI